MAKFSASMVIVAITWLVVPTVVQALASSMEQDKKEREGKQERERDNKFIPFRKFIESVEGANTSDFLSRPTSRVKDAESFEQMRQYILEFYEGVIVRHSWILGSQHFDCVPVEQQPTARALGIENIDLTQPSTVPQPLGAGRLPEGAITLSSPLGPDEQFDQFGNSRLCEVGTIPMDRITLDRLIHFNTLGQFFQKGPGLVELPPGEPPEPPAGGIGGPPAPGYLHSQVYLEVPNFGGDTFLTIWKPDVEPGANNHSISQQWYTGSQSGLCRGDDTCQTIESGWIVAPDSYIGDKNPHLFIYFTPDAYSQNGRGCYDMHCSPGFFANPVKELTGWALGMKLPASVAGGPRFGFTMSWQSVGDGNWSLFINDLYFGMYPKSVFAQNKLGQPGQMTKNATLVVYGGEVVARDINPPEPTPCRNGGLLFPACNWPQMGSGRFAPAAYQVGMQYLNTSMKFFPSPWVLLPPSQLQQNVESDPRCYTQELDPIFTDRNIFSIFFFGGPGGFLC